MTPTRAQIEASKERNRERYGEDGVKVLMKAAKKKQATPPPAAPGPPEVRSKKPTPPDSVA